MKNKSGIFSRLTNSKASENSFKYDLPERMVRLYKVSVENIPSQNKKNINGNYSVLTGRIKPFDGIDTDELRNKITEFETINIESLSDDEVVKKVQDIVSEVLVETTKVQPGSEVYRARDCAFVGKGDIYYKNETEVWCAPKSAIKWGRLNSPGEQLLYTSFDAITPMHEIRCLPQKSFALMKYTVKKSNYLNIAYISVGKFKNIYQNPDFIWTNKGKENWKLIDNFIENQFSTIISQGDDKAYRTTVAISKMYDFPGCDGFFYPSVLSDMSFNLAIKGTSINKLEFAGLTYCRYIGKSNDPRRAGSEYDFIMYRLWSTAIDKHGVIHYEPVSNCQIVFNGLGKPSKDVLFEP